MACWLLPHGAAAHRAEGVAQVEQFEQGTHEVLVVPFAVFEVPAHQFGHVVEERLVSLGRLAAQQVEQGRKVVVGELLPEGGKRIGRGGAGWGAGIGGGLGGMAHGEVGFGWLGYGFYEHACI